MSVNIVSLLRAELVHRAGTYAGQWAVRHPHVARRALVTLERLGLRQAGWAILALDLAARGGGQ